MGDNGTMGDDDDDDACTPIISWQVMTTLICLFLA
jgi:hypothetical protein